MTTVVDSFFKPDPEAMGCKGLVYVGNKVVVCRRDDRTDDHPLELDLPGGGPQPGETPFQTFQREVREEVNLRITPQDIVYCQRYPSRLQPGKFFYFPVAKLSESAKAELKLGDEGKEIMLMTPEYFVAAPDAWFMLKDRIEEYLRSHT